MSTESQEPEPQDQDVVVATEGEAGEVQPPTTDGPQTVDVASLPPHVHWTGVAAGAASRREIREEDFKKNGVDDQATVVWSRENDFRVPLDTLSEGAIKVIARQDNMHFVNTEEQAEKSESEGDTAEASSAASKHRKK